MIICPTFDASSIICYYFSSRLIIYHKIRERIDYLSFFWIILLMFSSSLSSFLFFLACSALGRPGGQRWLFIPRSPHPLLLPYLSLSAPTSSDQPCRTTARDRCEATNRASLSLFSFQSCATLSSLEPHH